MKQVTAIFLAMVLILGNALGCAKKAENVQAAYVSPLQYQSHSCEQLGQELARVQRKTQEVASAQDKTANKDAAAMTVGMVLFWPALIFLAGGDREQELARLKGECEAIESIAIQKDCTILINVIAEAKEQEEVMRKKMEQEKAERTKKQEQLGSWD